MKVDDFFLEYLDTRHLPVELNTVQGLGLDFQAMATRCRLNPVETRVESAYGFSA